MIEDGHLLPEDRDVPPTPADRRRPPPIAHTAPQLVPDPDDSELVLALRSTVRRQAEELAVLAGLVAQHERRHSSMTYHVRQLARILMQDPGSIIRRLQNRRES